MKEQQCVILNGNWQVKSGDGKISCPVQVPGSVLSALTEQKIIENPYYRRNEYSTRELLRQDFIFSRTFLLEKQEGYIYELCCDGLDTVADIFLNGVLIKEADNMHLRYQIACTELLKDGENELKIHIHSAIRYMEEHIPEQGKEIHYTPCGAMKNNQYIRKAHSMFGWDWGPQLPDMGIWRDIYVRGFAGASLENVKIRQKHEGGQVEIFAEPFVKLAEGAEISLQEARKKCPELNICMELITPEKTKLPFSGEKCLVEKPQLWWPNRYGEQPLYTIKVQLFSRNELLNEKQYRIGLRTLTICQERDEWGKEFAFCVNGIKIFAKGANYIPEDCIYSQITSKRIRFLLETAAESGFNCIRVWGGGYYPSEAFYDYCDEKGLIVWQDFMYACNVYELTDKFRESIIAETKDNVKRLRHHASLGIWCGNNEIESAWAHWGGFCDHSDTLRQDYLAMFEDIIPEALRSEDEVTFYWPSSPSSGGGFQNPDSDRAGDCHYWDVWHGEKPFTDYDNYYFRFCSEFGFQSFPSVKTIAAFTLPEDRNIFTEVMESHQKNEAANGKILRYISDNFLYPKDFKSLIYISQVLQGIAIKEGVEHWRRNRGRCMGTIYWQLNDNWPVASWASVDYYGRWKALQYMVKHFYADILGSLKVSEGQMYTPYVQNETFKDSQTQVQFWVRDMDGTILYETTGQIMCEALSVAAMEGICLKEILAGKENYVFVEAVFNHSDGSASHQVKMPKPYKHMHLKKAKVTCNCTRKEDELLVVLKSDVPAFFVEIETDNDMVLSDNFIHMTENREYKITGTLPEGYQGLPQVNVQSLCDSYEFPNTL